MKNKLTSEESDAIQAQCEEQVWEPFPGITIVAWNLPNGFALKNEFGRGDADA